MKKWLVLTIISCILLLLVSCNTEAITTETDVSSPITTDEGITETLSESIPSSNQTIKELKVHFIDVGQGDAILIDLVDIEILIDGGDKSPGVVSYLDDYVDGQLEVLVATHPHADHIGGLIAVLDTYEVKQIWHNGDTSTSKTYSEFIAAIQSESAEVHTAKLHDRIIAGELSFYVHHPGQKFDSINNNSIVLHLAYGDTDFLFMGDAEIEAEGAMMSLSSVRIPEVEILKVGHHGSRTASSEDLLMITSPEVAIYTAGEGNSYGHPHEETIQALNDIGAKVYGTDICGTIIVTTNGEEYTLQTEKQCEPIIGAVSTPPPTPVEPTLEPTPTEQVDIQITRIFYDGQVYRTESDEYVEIKNMGSVSINLDGWQLADISEGYPTFTFPSYTLEPGQTIRVYTNEIHSEYGGFSFGSGKAVWNNSSPDTAVLYDAQGQEVSRKSY